MEKIKVLLIDDEKLLVKSMTIALECYGFAMRSAFDGPSGLAAAAESTPDIILLDIMMPGMNGWEVLKKLKHDGATKNVPVVIFTAKEYSGGYRMAAEQGAADYMAKPFELEDMAAILNKHVSQRGR